MPEYTGSNLNGKQFASTIQMLSQQKDSRFGDKVRNESVNNAEEAYFNLFDAMPDPTPDTDRHGNTPWGEYEANRRKTVPKKWEKGTMIDKKDVRRMTVDPQNPVVQAQSMSFSRKKDKIIYAEMIGTAYEGKEGTTAILFKDESVSINGDGTVTVLGTAAVNNVEVPMTMAKMLTMMTLFNEAEVDPSIMKYWAVSPNDIKHMLNLTEVASSDYNTVKALQEGKLETYMGFKFFWWNFLNRDAVDGTSNRTVAWAQDGMILAKIGAFNTQVSILPEHKYSTGVYSEFDLGAVRMEGAKVHECLNLVTQTLTAPSAR
jgi:hypothetical protein